MREIELKPSRRLGLLLGGMAVLSGVAIGLAALPWGLRWALGIGVAGVMALHWRRRQPVTRLRIGGNGQLHCLDEAGEWRDAEVQGDSFVSPALTVLRYRLAGQPVRTLTLLSDSADADDLRRLRVSLRWGFRIRSDTASPDAG